MPTKFKIVPLPFSLVEWKCSLDDLHVNEENWAYVRAYMSSISYQLCEKAFNFSSLSSSSWPCLYCFSWNLLMGYAKRKRNGNGAKWKAYFMAVVCKWWIIYMQIFMICLDENDAYEITFWLWGKQTLHSNSQFAAPFAAQLVCVCVCVCGVCEQRNRMCVQQFGYSFSIVHFVLAFACDWPTLNASKHWLIVSDADTGRQVMRYLSHYCLKCSKVLATKYQTNKKPTMEQVKAQIEIRNTKECQTAIDSRAPIESLN